MSTPVGPPQFPPPVDPDDPGRGPAVVGVTWTFTIIAMMAVALRFYVRKHVGNRTWGLDDWLMLLALLFQIAYAALFSVSYHYGFGMHDRNVQMPEQFTEIMKWAWIGTGPGQVTSILARISITISLIGLFGVHRWFRRFLIVLTTIQTCLGISILVISYTQARPFEALWNVFMDPTTVWRLDPKVFDNVGYATQSVYTLADVTYVLIPVIIVWRLHLDLHKRLGLVAMLGAMSFTAAMSILKLQAIEWRGNPKITDPLYRSSLLVLYAGLEQSFVMIMGCVPSLRAIVKVKLPLGLSRLSQSVASLLSSGRWSSGGEKSKNNSDSGVSWASVTVNAKGSQGGRDDLELGTRNLGHHHNHHHHGRFSGGGGGIAPAVVIVGHSATASGNGTPLGGTTSTENLVSSGGRYNNGNYVLRTDQFSVHESFTSSK